MHDVVEVTPQLALCSAMLKRELAVPQNCPEDVVEVVSNPAGECADCLHLLRLPQLSFELLLDNLRRSLRSHVNRGTDESVGFAFRVEQTAPAREQPAPVAVGLADAILAFIVRAEAF